MRWKWNRFKACYTKGLGSVYFIPLVRASAGILIVKPPPESGLHVAVSVFDEPSTTGSEATLFQSEFAGWGGETAILSPEQAQPYIDIVVEALGEARNARIDIKP